jgi:hypothetical protein
MTKPEILDWLESEVQGYPERVIGNECEDHIVRIAGCVVESGKTENSRVYHLIYGQKF